MTTASANLNPFVGLRPFEEDDRELFFGRDRDCEVLLNLVYSSPVTLLYASSGVGKSSLIRAGVVPKLRADTKLRVLVYSDWRAGFLQQLQELAGFADATDPEPGLCETLEASIVATHTELVLILDQLEEIFHYPEEELRLWEEIARVAYRPSTQIHVLLSIREDHLGDLEPLISLVPALMANGFRLETLAKEALHEAFSGPLGKLSPPWTAEKNLFERLLSDLQRTSPGPALRSRVEPGYFQVVCENLWESENRKGSRRLTHATFGEQGGAQGIVDRFVRRRLGGILTPQQQELLYAIARYLVLPTGGKVRLAAADLVGLVRREDFPQPTNGAFPEGSDQRPPLASPRRRAELVALLNRLCAGDMRILRRVSRGARTEFQLVHDLLGTILLGWREVFRAEWDAQLRRELEAEYEDRSLDDEQVRRRDEWRNQLGRAKDQLQTGGAKAVDAEVVDNLGEIAVDARLLDSKSAEEARNLLRKLGTDRPRTDVVSRQAQRAYSRAESVEYYASDILRPKRADFVRSTLVFLYHWALSTATSFASALLVGSVAGFFGWHVSFLGVPSIALASVGAAWAVVYQLESHQERYLIKGALRLQVLSAPFVPYRMAIEFWEFLAGYPLNFLFTSGTATIVGVAVMNLSGGGFTWAFTVTLLVLTLGMLGLYAESVMLI
jgi:hypothetical protein